MNYRRLGDAGIRLSEIGLGGWMTFGSTLDMDRARAIFNRAFDAGINFFDTANAYADGRCEQVWGEILQDRRRSDYVLATKVYFPMGNGPNDRGLSRKHIMEQCHASLRRLRTDYIDLYQCHRWDENVTMEELVRAMDDLIHQGKVLYWGFSEWPIEQIEQALQTCGDRYYRPKSSQPGYSLLRRGPEEKLFALTSRAGIGNVTFSPLAQGTLSGKYKPGEPFPADSRAADDRANMFIKRFVGDPEILRKVQKLSSIAQEHHCSTAQLAIAWCLRRPEVTSVITGATKPEQVTENAEASGIKLDEATIRRMEELLA
ncbi:aldo/keto reductase family protein [Fontivita pretiosa]|uniref:aldo/keto reductase family protein n=1 Tax=Fontivita pretiosa TaxID=2989684 RepID=UPI003D185578